MPKKKKASKSKQKMRENKKTSNKINKTKLYDRPALVGMAGFVFQFVLGVFAYYGDILIVPYEKVLWVTGVIFIFVGFVITYLYQKEHEGLEEDVMNTIYPEEVTSLLTGGVYGVVRHPGYLGTIMMQLGMAFASRSYLPILFAVLMAVFWVLVALKEERLLQEQFKKEYEEYKEDVRWRFIPGLF
jgi:protein-S-isoprenylcysteine O-methyltransferase Ste14